MKVVQINSVCGVGSTGKLAVQISDYLEEKNVENYIFFGYGNPKRKNTKKIGNMLEAHFHSFISRNFCMQGYGSIIVTYRIVNALKRVKPDIVHLHNIHGHFLNYKILFDYLNSSNVQVVWTFHDCWPMTGKCTHFTAVGCDKWQSLCSDCCQLSSYPDSKRDRSTKNYIDKRKTFTGCENLHIITVSKWLKSVVEKSYFKDMDIRCIYNGVDKNIFYPRTSDIRNKLGVSNQFIILGVASKWSKGKNLDVFLNLAQLLTNEFRIILIGLDDNIISSLPQNMIGLKAIHDQDLLSSYYSAADVLLSMSMEETFGLVVAESLACGTPAVVIDSTASPEIVDKNSGIVIPNTKTDTVYNAILEVKNNGKDAYSKHCVDRVNNLFSNSVMQHNYYNLYKSLCEN